MASGAFDGWGMNTDSPTSWLEPTVRDLCERAPTLPCDAPVSAIAAACLAEEANDWLVLVDGRDRPVRLIDRAALVLGAPFEHPVVGVAASCSVAAAARRAGPYPLVVQDSHGCYVGVVRTERLLDALGG